MFEGLHMGQLCGAIEALLFVSDEPISTSAIANMVEVDTAQAKDALRQIQDRLDNTDSGICLREIAGGWRLFTREEYHDLIEKYVLSWDTRKLSQAALETLAIVAYAQPVTRNGVTSIRGVQSDSAINSLVEKGLVKECGVANTAGNPILYATTRVFLEKFGLRSTGDLPDIEQFAPDVQTREFIMQRLGATHIESIDGDTAGNPNENDLASLDNLDDSDNHLGGYNNFDNIIDFDAQQQRSKMLLEQATQKMLEKTLASSTGVVEKIDFDKLNFETDDE